MSKKTTYTKITAKIIFITLFFTLITAYIYGEYMKKDAVSNLAHIDAKKTSMLVFESLYSAMQRGWNKNDLNEIINRLNNVDKNMEVNIYRSPLVAELYGDIEKDKTARESIDDVKNAMDGVETLNISDSDFIEYYYPVVAKNDCIKCHTNVKVGDTLGVIDISYPINDLKVSLSEMINFFIVFIILFSLIVFLAIFIELDNYLIKPIQRFSTVIKTITNSHDVKMRIQVDDNIEEIDSIKDVFNAMLDSIEHQFYYDALTGLQNRRRLIEMLELRQNSFLMIINIDSFQEINDLYGDDAGDNLLKEFAVFLQTNIPKQSQLFRLHADEFAYLCQEGIDLKEFTTYASLISEKISKESFNINSKSEVSLTATIGISYGTNMLLPNADTALLVAKRERKHYLVYDDSMAMSKEYENNFNWTKQLKKSY